MVNKNVTRYTLHVTRYALAVYCLLFTLSSILFVPQTRAGTITSTRTAVNFNEISFFSRFSNLGALIGTLLPNVLIVAGLILLVYIIVAGFKLMQSGGSSEDTGKSKQAITAALIGFFLIFASYFIIQLIEFLTGVSIFNAAL